MSQLPNLDSSRHCGNQDSESKVSENPSDSEMLKVSATSSIRNLCKRWGWTVLFIFGTLLVLQTFYYVTYKREAFLFDYDDDQQILFPEPPKEKPIGIVCKPLQQTQFKSEAQSEAFEGSVRADMYQPHVVVEFEYTNDSYAVLPINPLRKNSQGKGIEEVLYKDEETRNKRVRFIKQRAGFAKSYQHLKSLYLAKYNMISDQQKLERAIWLNQRDWLRLQKKFGLSNIKEELPICIVVTGYNNNANFRIEANLNSAFTQNYSNYKVVIIDDASNDGSGQLYRDYLNFYSINKTLFTFIENSKHVTKLQNIYFAAINHCGEHSIVIDFDADDEFIGRNVLKVFNWAYQVKKAGVVYSNFYFYTFGESVQQGFTRQYTDEEKNNNLYRETDLKFSQLRSFRVQLLRQMDIKALLDSKGEFYKTDADQALFLPLMEASCGRVHKIQGEFHYIYNKQTNQNAPTIKYFCTQIYLQKIIRKRKKLECFKKFDQKMKK